MGRNLLYLYNLPLASALRNAYHSHKQTTANHPKSNGAVERLHRCLKETLRARVAVATWSEELPFDLLVLIAQLREDTSLFPAEAVFGAQIALPNEFLQNDELSVDTIVQKYFENLACFFPFFA